MTTTPFDHFRHAIDIQVRWRDMDALAHVNNAAYLTYLEQARIRYIHDLGLWDGAADKLGLIVARVVIDYKLPLVAEDRVTVYTRMSRLGTKSCETEQYVTRQSDGEIEVAAIGAVTLVVFDYTRNQSTPLPDDWRTRITAYEPGLRQ